MVEGGKKEQSKVLCTNIWMMKDVKDVRQIDGRRLTCSAESLIGRRKERKKKADKRRQSNE